MATPFGIDLNFWEHRVLAWTGAVAVAFWVRGFGKGRWHEGAGYALMSVPVWSTLWAIIDSLSVLADPDSVLRPYTRYGLSYITSQKLLEDLGFLVAGLLVLVSGGSWRKLWQLGLDDVSTWLAVRGFPMGARSEGRSALFGVLIFPVILIATILMYAVASGSQALNNGDEASVWDNMSLYHVVLLAAAAAFGEELLYRGFLQTVLQRWWGVWPAIVVQAIFFGFAHAGYGTWIHVLGPLAFGLITGVLAWRYGIWAAIVVHFLIDVYAFGVYLPSGPELLAWLLILNALATVIAVGLWIRRSVKGTAAIGQ